MLDLVGNPKDRFSHNEAHIVYCFKFLYLHQLLTLFLKKYIFQWAWRGDTNLSTLALNQTLKWQVNMKISNDKTFFVSAKRKVTDMIMYVRMFPCYVLFLHKKESSGFS